MIDKSTVDRIYATANIIEIVGDFITLKKKGINYQACCPFHNEKTPSFVVSPAKGMFKCFGCGKGGNAVTFVMEHENMEYADALKYVARKYNIEIQEKESTPEEKQKNDDRESMMVVSSYASDFFKKTLHDSDEGRSVGLSYFRERGFSDATIEKFQLGFCPTSGDGLSKSALSSGYNEDYLIRSGLSIKRDNGNLFDRFTGRVIFPIHGISGRVVGFGGRTLRTDKKVAKYLNSPESEIYHKSNILYGLFYAKKAVTQEDCCILVEGYTDVISMHQSGVENVVASSGTSLTEEQIKLIARFTKNITVIYDGDSAGIKASIRGIDMILREGLNVRVVSLPENEDPDSFARARSAVELRQHITENEEDFISFKTKLLMRDAKNDPIKRAELVSDIVESISAMPNAISRNIYIKECSELMKIDESILNDEVRRKRKDSEFSSQEKGFFRKRELLEKAIASEVATNRHTGIIGSSIEEFEKEIITYLLKYGRKVVEFDQNEIKYSTEVAKAIIDDLQADSIEFVNTAYNTIYKEYSEIYKEDLPEFPMNRLTDYPDPQVCNIVVDIMMRGEVKPSKIWERNEIFVANEEEMLHQAVPRAITLYKSKIIEKMITTLMAEISGMPFDATAAKLMQQIDILNKARKEVCAKYSRIIL